MPSTTYIIRFTHRTPGSGIPCEEQEHIGLAQAFLASVTFMGTANGQRKNGKRRS